jgi:hypothetical protein
MNTEKHIDSSINQLRKMLGDPNNELTSEQQRKLKLGIRDLKRLRKAFTHEEAYEVASRIAEVAREIMKNQIG